MQPRRTYRVGASTLSLEFGDITTSHADVLVSSDDLNLTMGGGVSAAIRRAAGEGILLEVVKRIPAKLGDVVVTGAGSLPAKHVFHAITIGDRERGERAEAGVVVRNATRRSLQLLKTLGLSSIAFPAIGAGSAGFSYGDVAVSMAETVVDELRDAPQSIDVTIYLFDRFGRMQPIDYVQFFEEFAARTRGLRGVVAEPTAAAEPKTVTSPRTEALGELQELDRDRQALEGRLAQYHGSLSQTDVEAVKKRLDVIQERRVELLASVIPRPAELVSVFVSYAHEDEPLRKELEQHLALLVRQGVVRIWYDRQIGAGSEWKGLIDEHLNDARVILLLISSAFLYSDYCDAEMKRALERHADRSALVVPVLLRPISGLEHEQFSGLQILPKDAKAVTTWPDRDLAFVEIVDGLRKAIDDLAVRR